jgi:MFS superfamily sulfate permease-like transporter
MARFLPKTLARDVPASIVVFLVALPLCMGIAIASGAPPEKGLLTGIVGGTIVGCFAGSPLQISGPAAGLAVIVFELISEQGIGALGPILMLSGLFQLVAGLLKLGQWFRAISPAVVHGMLAGIGILIVAGQLHVMIDQKPLAHGIQNLFAAPKAYLGLWPLSGKDAEAPLLIGLVTIVVMLGWERIRPPSLRLVPGALLGVAAGTLLAMSLGLKLAHVQVPASIIASIDMPTWADMGELLSVKALVTAGAIAFIASAETLLSAAAVDRMHDGVRTNYNRELSSQGIGNMLCGFLGGLPMTGVIVRSSANVQAGAATRASAILHGCWMLAAVVLLPWLLRTIPMAALAGVLIVTGYRLVSLVHFKHLLHRYGILPAGIFAVTLGTVVASDLLTGVLVGIGLSLIEILPFVRKLRLLVHTRRLEENHAEVTLAGSATMLQFPPLANALDAVPTGGRVTIRMRSLWYVDHTCAEYICDWIARRRAAGDHVEIEAGSVARHTKMALTLQHA